MEKRSSRRNPPIQMGLLERRAPANEVWGDLPDDARNHVVRLLAEMMRQHGERLQENAPSGGADE